MIEITIRNFLSNRIGVPVLLEAEKEKSSSFILLERTGGGGSHGLKSSTFAFQSYAGSMYEAAALNEILKAELEQIIILDEIVSITLNSDYNFTDTTTKQYRYQAVYDFKHY